jgi:site-specific recombinase XerD
MEFLQKFERELSIRKYSPKTIKSYLACLEKYFAYKKEAFEKFDEESVKDFLYRLTQKKFSASLINQNINAIQFFYREVLKVPQRIHFKFAKKPQKLPIALTRNEIENCAISVRLGFLEYTLQKTKPNKSVNKKKLKYPKGINKNKLESGLKATTSSFQ